MATTAVFDGSPATEVERTTFRLLSWERLMRAVRIVELMTKLRGLNGFAPIVDSVKEPLRRDAYFDLIQTGLEECDSLCAEIGLPVSRLHLRDHLRALSERLSSGFRVAAEHTPTHIDRILAIVSDSIEKELSLMAFYTVPSDKAKYLQAFAPESDATAEGSVESLWEPVFVAFPSTSFDAKEAFKSYALGRSTACVFHLMRVLELGLRPLGAVFGVSLDHKNWQIAIQEIEKHIRNMHADPTWKALPDCKEQQEYYAQAASHFGVLKDAWRNYTAHARGQYQSQEAADILMSVRAFMAKLALRLSE